MGGVDGGGTFVSRYHDSASSNDPGGARLQVAAQGVEISAGSKKQPLVRDCESPGSINILMYRQIPGTQYRASKRSVDNRHSGGTKTSNRATREQKRSVNLKERRSSALETSEGVMNGVRD